MMLIDNIENDLVVHILQVLSFSWERRSTRWNNSMELDNPYQLYFLTWICVFFWLCLALIYKISATAHWNSFGQVSEWSDFFEEKIIPH